MTAKAVTLRCYANIGNNESCLYSGKKVNVNFLESTLCQIISFQSLIHLLLRTTLAFL